MLADVSCMQGVTQRTFGLPCQLCAQRLFVACQNGTFKTDAANYCKSTKWLVNYLNRLHKPLHNTHIMQRPLVLKLINANATRAVSSPDTTI
jgi:hypothetical protein